MMADLPGYLRSYLQSGKLALLAILACALYNNWWPMLTVLMYVLLPMPLLFLAGFDSNALFSKSESGWVNATKFLTRALAIGSIAIPGLLKHAGVIGWGALAMEFSSFFIFVLSIMCYNRMSAEDYYSALETWLSRSPCSICVKKYQFSSISGDFCFLLF